MRGYSGVGLEDLEHEALLHGVHVSVEGGQEAHDCSFPLALLLLLRPADTTTCGERAYEHEMCPGRGAYSESALAALVLEGVEADPKRPASVAATSRMKLETSRCSLTSWRPQAALSSRATCSTAKGVKIWVRHREMIR